MEYICDHCKKQVDCKMQPSMDAVFDCGMYERRENPTNADRIRSMSDEELAKFLNDSDGCIYETSDVRCDEDTECSNCIRKWLKSEVTESDTQ